MSSAWQPFLHVAHIARDKRASSISDPAVGARVKTTEDNDPRTPQAKRRRLNTLRYISDTTKALSITSTLMLISQFATTAHATPAKFQNKEVFFCGQLGTVIVRSGSQPNLKAGHVTYVAQLEIPARKKVYPGVLHNFMGGNDRTFTRYAWDKFGNIDGTTVANPVMINIRMGSYFYGKRREEITISLLQEAYTCIPR